MEKTLLNVNLEIIYNNDFYNIKIKNDNNNILIDKLNKQFNLLNKIINNNKLNIFSDNELNKLEKNLNHKLDNNNNTILSLTNQLIVTKDKLYNEEYKYNTLLNKFDNIINKSNNEINLSTQDLGTIGENTIFNYLQSNLELTNAKLESVKGKKNSGDIYLKYNNLNCCIESKNHNNPISQSQLNRFSKTDVLNPIYNCGIFISIKSEFVQSSNLNHFDIKFINDPVNNIIKPAIYITNFIKKSHDLILAIKILDFILYHQSKKNIYLNNYIEMLKNNLILFDSLNELNNNNIKNLQNSILLIKNKKLEIEKLLNLK